MKNTKHDPNKITRVVLKVNYGDGGSSEWEFNRKSSINRIIDALAKFKESIVPSDKSW